MSHIKVTLCVDCEHCPEVEITDEAVLIGEEGNIVRLTHREWNDLVAKVRAGEVGAV